MRTRRLSLRSRLGCLLLSLLMALACFACSGVRYTSQLDVEPGFKGQRVFTATLSSSHLEKIRGGEEALVKLLNENKPEGMELKQEGDGKLSLTLTFANKDEYVKKINASLAKGKSGKTLELETDIDQTQTPFTTVYKIKENVTNDEILDWIPESVAKAGLVDNLTDVHSVFNSSGSMLKMGDKKSELYNGEAEIYVDPLLRPYEINLYRLGETKFRQVFCFTSEQEAQNAESVKAWSKLVKDQGFTEQILKKKSEDDLRWLYSVEGDLEQITKATRAFLHDENYSLALSLEPSADKAWEAQFTLEEQMDLGVFGGGSRTVQRHIYLPSYELSQSGTGAKDSIEGLKKYASSYIRKGEGQPEELGPSLSLDYSPEEGKISIKAAGPLRILPQARHTRVELGAGGAYQVVRTYALLPGSRDQVKKQLEAYYKGSAEVRDASYKGEDGQEQEAIELCFSGQSETFRGTEEEAEEVLEGSILGKDSEDVLEELKDGTGADGASEKLPSELADLLPVMIYRKTDLFHYEWLLVMQVKSRGYTPDSYELQAPLRGSVEPEGKNGGFEKNEAGGYSMELRPQVDKKSGDVASYSVEARYAWRVQGLHIWAVAITLGIVLLVLLLIILIIILLCRRAKKRRLAQPPTQAVPVAAPVPQYPGTFQQVAVPQEDLFAGDPFAAPAGPDPASVDVEPVATAPPVVAEAEAGEQPIQLEVPSVPPAAPPTHAAPPTPAAPPMPAAPSTPPQSGAYDPYSDPNGGF